MLDRAHWERRADHYGAVYDLPFFDELIEAESNFNPHAVSPAGAQGIAQFMPGTAASRGLRDPFDPEPALKASAALLREYVDDYGSYEAALIAYNAGPGRVDPSSSAFLPRDVILSDQFAKGETKRYVEKILGSQQEDGGHSSGGATATTCPKDVAARAWPFIQNGDSYEDIARKLNVPIECLTKDFGGEQERKFDTVVVDPIGGAITDATSRLVGAVEGVRQGATQALIGVTIVGVAILFAYSGARKIL